MKKHLFLDLEDTVITPITQGWHVFDTINIPKVKRFIDGWKPDFVNIFSFAIWDNIQKELFSKQCRPILERGLGVRLNFVPTVDHDIKLHCCAAMKLNPERVDFQDMVNFWSKQLAFRLFVPQWLKSDARVVLLDDAVEGEFWSLPDRLIHADIININKL